MSEEALAKRSAQSLQLQKSKSKTVENWLDKCGKLLEINSPQRHSQPFWNWFKAIGRWVLLHVGWAWGKGWHSLWGVQGAQRVPLPDSWDYNVEKRRQLAALEAKSLSSQGLEQSWGRWARCRAGSGVPRWRQGRAGAWQGCGSCCPCPASICPATLLKC